jgi:hypothetical protein
MEVVTADLDPADLKPPAEQIKAAFQRAIPEIVEVFQGIYTLP